MVSSGGAGGLEGLDHRLSFLSMYRAQSNQGLESKVYPILTPHYHHNHDTCLHPQQFALATKWMQKLNLAYFTLSDEKRRSVGRGAGTAVHEVNCKERRKCR